jgi:hypothetical protein
VGDAVSVSSIKLAAKGLVLAPGELSRAPGSLTAADNVVFEHPGVIRSRTGYARQTNALGGPIWKMVSTKQLGTSLLVNFGSETAASGLAHGDGSGAWTAISGTFSNDADGRMQVAVGRKNHYITCGRGVVRLESDFSIANAGLPDALPLDVNSATVLTGAPGSVVADTEAVAYRHTWCKKDAEGHVMEGAPSARTVVYNNARTSGHGAGVMKDVTFRVLIPVQQGTTSTALTTSYFFRVYRSASATGVPSDQMRLIHEEQLDAGDLVAGYVQVTDSTAEAFRALQDPLYTNDGDGGKVDPLLSGVDLASDPPPAAGTLEGFAGRMFYGDLGQRPRMQLTLLSTVASTGLTAADTVTVAGVVYTAVAPGAVANKQFQVWPPTGGTSVSEGLERTAIDLCRAINASADTTAVHAFYVSSSEDLWGRIVLISRNFSTFTFTSSRAAAWRTDAGASFPVSSPSLVFSNAFTWSDENEPDSVPEARLVRLGRDDTVLQRLISLGESLFAFTTDGVWRITMGGDGAPVVQEFDLSFRVAGRELVVECDGALYAWGVEGIARITETGAEYVSGPIEPKIHGLLNACTLAGLEDYGFAVAHRSQHRVVFSYPPSSASGNCRAALVYDTRIGEWSTWNWPVASTLTSTGFSCAAVRQSDDLLFFGQWHATTIDGRVYKERRTFAAADYKDDSASAQNIAITKTVTWSAATEDPSRLTHWQQLHLLYDVSPTFSDWTTPTAVSAAFTADRAETSTTVSLAPTATDKLSRMLVPSAQRRSGRLQVSVTHAVASEYFGLEGMVLQHMPPQGYTVTKT